MRDISVLEKIFSGELTCGQKLSLEIIRGLSESSASRYVVPSSSAQISGVSFYNIGPEGIDFLDTFAKNTRVKIKTTLNPGAFDTDNPGNHINSREVEFQKKIYSIYESMGISLSLSCSPYFTGNLPLYGQHISWSESSAVVFANSVLGARTNRESGISALSSAVTGFTPAIGLHLSKNRFSDVEIDVKDKLDDPVLFGLLGAWCGKNIPGKIPLFHMNTDKHVGVTHLQALSASIITYGGASMFHIEDFTPEWKDYPLPQSSKSVTLKDLNYLWNELSDDFEYDKNTLFFTGCPHKSMEDSLSIISRTNRTNFLCAGPRGSCKINNNSYMAGGCLAVSRLPDNIRKIVTDSVKAMFYLKNRGFSVKLVSAEEMDNLK
ncbi:MAG: DUF521 domain-containing protein [Deltaproteobacteria bacterium]|nr:DUF521 domain-containing protein [Deltaproteobacteria bacterium]